jgi:hypothetical protein
MRQQIVTRVIGALALIGMAGCGTLSKTRMVAAADYAPSRHVYVAPSPTPLFAGPDTVRTYSPDGSTIFVCADGTSRDASKLGPDGKPTCL